MRDLITRYVEHGLNEQSENGGAGLAPRALTDSGMTQLGSEEALVRIWNDPAEDEAWRDL